ncbi:hypothetical protein PCO86_05305 [Pectobacteriaceae bacterium CE70]|nr:hypothetical protein PCO87_05145 [Pectobacteriaceae bacterium C52]WJV67847.1 hypothetical protein PCO86_05305 [Pectobacteriaceae bacterium CE70]WJY11790.1 hypothetical protein PCO80_05120 [Pectobacteriaceae bacterium C80]
MQYGELALACCGKKMSLEVMKSRAGYYLGTSENTALFSRESVEYWRARGEAEDALRKGNWTQLTTITDRL